MTRKARILIFGASGAIGSVIANTFADKGWEVLGVSRNNQNQNYAIKHIEHNPLSSTSIPEELQPGAVSFDAVCWAQGSNMSDSVYNVEVKQHLALYEANCLYILVTLKSLLANRLLAPSARLCIISSIWQNLARQDKLSYCMSKAALQGLVLSASADLAREGMLINAILPGALDTPMTRRNISNVQLEKLETATYFNALPSVKDVAGLACYLCSAQNTSITGQFVSVDLGFSNVRLL